MSALSIVGGLICIALRGESESEHVLTRVLVRWNLSAVVAMKCIYCNLLVDCMQMSFQRVIISSMFVNNNMNIISCFPCNFKQILELFCVIKCLPGPYRYHGLR